MVSENTKSIQKSVLKDNPDPFALVQLESDDIADDPGKLADEATTVALFGGDRFIRVKLSGRKQITKSVEALLAIEPEDTTIVIEAGDLKKNNPIRSLIEKSKTAMALPCYQDDSRTLYRLIEDNFSKASIQADRDAVDLLVSLLGENRRTSLNEIEKLALFAHNTGRITSGDVEALIGDAATTLTDETVDHILTGNTEQALISFERTLSFGHSSFQLLSSLQRHLTSLQILRAKYDSGLQIKQVVDQARPPIHFKRKQAVTRQINAWNEKTLQKAQDRLTETIIETRTKPRLDETITKSLIVQLSAQAKRSTI